MKYLNQIKNIIEIETGINIKKIEEPKDGGFTIYCKEDNDGRFYDMYFLTFENIADMITRQQNEKTEALEITIKALND